MQSFATISRLFGHDTSQLRADAQVVSYARIPSLPEARRVFSRATPDIRVARSEVFYEGIRKRRRLFQGMHDRGEEFLFADGHMHEQDRINIESHLPLHSKLVSIETKVVGANEVWDLTLPYDHYGFGPREELYVGVNVGTLILEPNARVIVQGNIFSLCCQRIIRRGQPSANAIHPYDIGILPTTVPVDNRSGPLDGAHQPPGRAGRDGLPGAHHELRSGIFGPVWEAGSCPPMAGARGGDGDPGQDGENGRIGTMVKLAELTIGELENFTEHPLRIYSKPGDGGHGGNGGDGGRGGNGGNGGNGIVAGDKVLSPGPGGDGGQGAPGGRGGHGGNGGIASNIFVSIPVRFRDQLVTRSLPCVGGSGGKGGRGGAAGRGGPGGQLENAPEITVAATGTYGTPGLDGRKGCDGRSRPGANIFVFHPKAAGVSPTPCPTLQYNHFASR